MDYSSASAYVFAKAGGMLGKSFTGIRAARLFSVKSLSELWTLLFKKEVPLVPEIMLAECIEQEAERKFVSQYTKLVEMYSHPDEILIEQLRFYDVANLKELGAALCSHEAQRPYITDIGTYSLLHYDKWPSVAGITKGSPYQWYDTVPGVHEQQALDSKLDCQYVQRVWDAVNCTRGEVHDVIVDLFREEFVMDNIIWALRLRVYYDMKAENAVEYLASVTGKRDKSDPIFGPALSVLDKPVDSWADWENWKYAAYLNPHEESTVWRIDPRWVENAYKADDNRRSAMLFHKFPLTAAVLVSWYKIKRHELDCIRTATESIRLNADPAEAMKVAFITASGYKQGL
jgi:vacuolar-type H+-ATPase subunit C/Vma6